MFAVLFRRRLRLRRNEMTFASYVKTVCATPQICVTKKV